MTDAYFLVEDLADPLPTVGALVALTGPEGRHAVVVRRLQRDEVIVLTDGRGRGVRGRVHDVDRDGLRLQVTDRLIPDPPAVRFVAVQALAKGDRSELAVEMLTEVGVDEIVPWQANRSVVRWQGERGEKSRAKWQRTVQEATKQSRRLWVPPVAPIATMTGIRDRVREADLALILHESATESVGTVELPAAGTVVLIIGPEGGIDDRELEQLSEVGGRPVLLGDGVLRTSTAGVVAVAALTLRPGAGSR